MTEGKVLSIQSQVVYGYVGNKCATFPLQVLGFEVDVVNSVQFSNSGGYGYKNGQILGDKDLGDLMDGLKANDLDRRYTHLLTGYCASPTFLLRIAELIKYLRSMNSNIVYVCDPVMGDNGRFYVPESNLEIYRDILIPQADIITPNQFEAEKLSGKPIKNIDDAWAVINYFHDKGCKTVVVSSTQLANQEHLLCLASHVNDGNKINVSIQIPLLNESFGGTGDLFAALFLAWMRKSNNDLVTALENTLASLQGVLRRTLAAAEVSSVPGQKKSRADLELKLIQSKADIENPNVELRAQLLERIN